MLIKCALHLSIFIINLYLEVAYNIGNGEREDDEIPPQPVPGGADVDSTPVGPGEGGSENGGGIRPPGDRLSRTDGNVCKLWFRPNIKDCSKPVTGTFKVVLNRDSDYRYD